MTKEDINFVVDSHVHCGRGYTFREYHAEIRKTPIKSAIVFPLASDIYERENKNFKDNKEKRNKRREANKHVLSLSKDKDIKINIYPFKFAWNDFNREDFTEYFGVKWHRHYVDPKYEIGSPKFVRFINELRERNMPIVFEDEFENTRTFLDKWSEGINVIIPHLGFGGRNYDKLRERDIWWRENVYTDTSYVSDVSTEPIKEHIETYGHKRILFGSDYPFSNPQEELEIILSLDISPEEKEAIMSKNILGLLNKVKKQPK